MWGQILVISKANYEIDNPIKLECTWVIYVAKTER